MREKGDWKPDSSLKLLQLATNSLLEVTIVMLWGVDDAEV